MARADTTATLRRIVIFLLSLALVWAALQLLVWRAVQPWYSAAVTRAADAALGALEHGERVTHLKADGARILVFSDLYQDGHPSATYDADVMHFYVVLFASVILVFPALPARRRTILLAASMAGMFLFHVLAVLINVEHLYAVEMVLVSERNYTDAERTLWAWMRYAVDYFAMDLLPAATLVLLVVTGGGLRPRAGSSAAPSPAAPVSSAGRASRLRLALPFTAATAAVVVMALVTALLWHQQRRINARQAEKECLLGSQALTAEGPLEATRRFEAALARNPGLAPAHEGLGQTRMRQGDVEEAAGEFRRAIAIEPDNPVSHLHLGNALFAKSEFDAAAAEFAVAVELKPDQREALFNLAKALEKQGKRDEAEANLQHALEVSPDFADAAFELSASMIATNRACDARPYLEKLMALEPSSRRGILAARTLQGLTGRCGSRVAEPTRPRP